MVVVGGDFNGERDEFVSAGLGAVERDGALVLHCGGCGATGLAEVSLPAESSGSRLASTSARVSRWSGRQR